MVVIMIKRERETEEKDIGKYLIKDLDNWNDYIFVSRWNYVNKLYDTYEEAEKALQEMLESGLVNSQYVIIKLIKKARIYEKVGRYAKAKQYWRRVIDLASEESKYRIEAENNLKK